MAQLELFKKISSWSKEPLVAISLFYGAGTFSNIAIDISNSSSPLRHSVNDIFISASIATWSFKFNQEKNPFLHAGVAVGLSFVFETVQGLLQHFHLTKSGFSELDYLAYLLGAGLFLLWFATTQLPNKVELNKNIH